MYTHLFFGLLKRRDKYTTKSNGTFYAYRHYRENYHHEIAEDCQYRCVYCDLHENELGGRESMELDHFRPHTLASFKHLKNDPQNFHHACRSCNGLKSNTWDSTHPSNSHDGTVGFIDPFVEDRNKYFEIQANGILVAKERLGDYLIVLLELNRAYATEKRELRILVHDYGLKVKRDNTYTKEEKREITELIDEILEKIRII